MHIVVAAAAAHCSSPVPRTLPVPPGNLNDTSLHVAQLVAAFKHHPSLLLTVSGRPAYHSPLIAAQQELLPLQLSLHLPLLLLLLLLSFYGACPSWGLLLLLLLLVLVQLLAWSLLVLCWLYERYASLVLVPQWILGLLQEWLLEEEAWVVLLACMYSLLGRRYKMAPLLSS